MAKPPATNYNFNTMQEIKSHSSVLYNERMHFLFILLDMKSMNLNKNYSVNDMLEVRATLRQIYLNIRMLIRFNPTVRATLNLDTHVEGVYTLDVMFDTINKLVEYCENTCYTTRQLYIITEELNSLQTAIKDTLQYFQYFIRPDFRQKPDVDAATDRYKQMADSKTVEELKNIVGKNHKIDFEGLGTRKIELLTSNASYPNERTEDDLYEDDDDILAYNPDVDGPEDIEEEGIEK